MNDSTLVRIITFFGILFLLGTCGRYSVSKYVAQEISHTVEGMDSDIQFMASFFPAICDIQEMEQEVASLELRGNRIGTLIETANFGNAMSIAEEIGGMLHDVEEIHHQLVDIKMVVNKAETYDEQTRKLKRELLKLIQIIDRPIDLSIRLKKNVMDGRWWSVASNSYGLYQGLVSIEANFGRQQRLVETSLNTYANSVETNLETAIEDLPHIAIQLLRVLYFGNEGKLLGNMLYDSFIAVAMESTAFADSYQNGCLSDVLLEMRETYIKKLNAEQDGNRPIAKIDGRRVQALNMRSDCSFSDKSNVIKTLKTSDQFEIIGETKSCYQIIISGQKGYVSKKYVRPTNSKPEFSSLLSLNL